MSTRVLEAIRHRIRTDGPIDVATYMTLALYGPAGFYGAPPIGAEGDFVTSPHVHPAFGTFVAQALEELAAALPEADPVRVLEVGAGDGTLARQVLAAGLGRSVAYAAVEISDGARRALRQVEGVSVIEHERRADLVIAHELLDNLPFRVVRDGWEVTIGLDGEDLVERPAPIGGELRDVIGDADTSGELVVPIGALAWIDRVAEVLGSGYALLIDYGGESAGGAMHGYRAHVPIADILATPGDTDITAGVDFGWIARHAERRELRAFAPVRQRDALLALGFEAWLTEQRDEQRALLAADRGSDAVRLWSMRSRATMLVDTDGLGAMWWLLLGAGPVPEPRWLGAARGPATD